MPANDVLRENDFVEDAIEWLRLRLPADWEIKRSARAELVAETGRLDAAVDIRSPGFETTLVIEAKRSLGPREVTGLFGTVGRTLRTLSPHIPILVVAPWLSRRTRDLLTAEGVNYLDLTGNARIKLDRPPLFVDSQGADRDPAPAQRGKARVRGPKAGRLVRTLVDVWPPYGVRELAETTGLAPGYVSRLLDALDDDALVERSKRGQVESVDIAGLLRRWTDAYDVFRSNAATTFLAPRGASDALSALANIGEPQPIAVSGSFAAVRYAPIAAPSLLVVYSEASAAVAAALGAIPADTGANLVVLRPFDPVVWDRTVDADSVQYVAPSQVVADCLTGNGRMPSEGEALLEWMVANESAWRLSSLPGGTGPSST